MLIRRGMFDCLLTILVMAAVLTGCGNNRSGEANPAPLPTVMIISTVQKTVPPSETKIVTPPIRSTPTPVGFGPLFDPNLDLQAGPIEVPLELQIPSLKVHAPVLGVGLINGNMMDAPTGPVDDPVWHAAYWYRGSGIPGESGTATIAGHVNDPLGVPEIFAKLKNLDPGDKIIIHYSTLNIDVLFIVDEVIVYTLEESSDPAVLAQIFGDGPITGIGPQPASDGGSHLTLITCAGYIVNGQFDHHTVVYATRSE